MLSRRLLRIKVIKALYSHFKSDSDSLIASQNNLTTSVNKTYDLYHQMLWLIVEVMRFGQQQIEAGRRKKLPTREDLNPNTKFVDNKVIRRIETNQDLGVYLEKKGLGWVRHPELIKKLYRELSGSDFYKNYMDSGKSSFKEDALFCEDFYVNLVDDNPDVEQVLEEQSIMWSDDMDFSLIMVVRTIGSMKESQTCVPLLSQFKSEDDREFYKELFSKTLVNYSEYLPYIEKYTQNWDLERIAFMDNVIMACAMAELLNFPSIPVKVTLDEYIEISKHYSTPGSSVFINGVLDRVVAALTAEGRINKAGRGLL